MLKDRKRTDKIRKILRITYPEVKTQLDHENPFQLLVATILSAQCTDKQVNSVTTELFDKLATPADFAEARLELIEKLIRTELHADERIKSMVRAMLDQSAAEITDAPLRFNGRCVTDRIRL